MELSLVFLLNSVLLGAGLAMDAFSVSMANGLHEPEMRAGRMSVIAGTFGGFQILMPLTGWFCVHTVLQYFEKFQKWIPWIALALLVYIGGEMLLEGLRGDEAEDAEKNERAGVGPGALFIQGIATSIDALSVGFTIADYGWQMAVLCAVIVGAVTYMICMCGLVIGKRFGMKLSNKAAVLGGVILIGIGVEIFVRGLLGA